MNFGNKLKKERKKRGWSQDYLAEKIFVSRQYVSKWETDKNYPSIEIIIDLSNLFNITIDELLSSDDGLKEKVIQDSNKTVNMNYKTQLLDGLCILVGIIIASIIKNGEIEWLSIVEAVFYTAAFLYLVIL